jgi:hypothetical protein
MRLYQVEQLTNDDNGLEFYQAGAEDPKTMGPFYKLTDSELPGQALTALPKDLIFNYNHMPATKANIIRMFYSIDDEFNVLNKGIDDKTNVEYTTYKLLINSL